ncbi:coiled-coil domain-containing protein 178 isoform X2 [Ambystoma mexicanum]|uniref:coiled-coil domain-containing protein 178 isoform X2 n=1 Tax=Ambystoma mexicanum TaxID=8296 RepID=UPI0037E8C938
MPDVQLLPCCPKENDSSISDALVPLVCIGKDDKEYASGKNAVMILSYPTKRRSCTLVNTPSPCVNKAIYHIEALEGKMKEWLEQYEQMPKEENSSWVSYLTSDAYDDTALLKAPQKLHVVGVGLIESDPDRYLFLKHETEDVLSEVIALIWRLEADRQETEEALKQERQRKKTLSFKIDRLSRWRLQHLGAAVQKEHEACARDIAELQWHISIKKQLLHKAQEHAGRLEAANAKLLQDVSFLEKHSPLLEEKLQLEDDALAHIRKTQAEATLVFNEANQKREDAQMEFDKHTEEANKERAIMTEELEAAKKMLAKFMMDLNQYEDSYNKSCAMVSESKRQLVENEKMSQELQTQRSAIEENEIFWKGKVDDLKCATDAQETSNKNLSDECIQLTEEMMATKANCESEILNMEEEFHNKLHALRDLQYKIKELDIKNEDFVQKIKDSTERKLKLQADILRMQNTIKRNEEQCLQMTTDLDDIRMVHEATKIKMDELGDQAAREETRMKNLTEILKKQSADEIKATQLIQARSSAILADLKDKQMESKKRRQELSKMASDIENPIMDLEASAHEMRKSKTNLMEELSCTVRRNQALAEKQTRLHGELGKKKSSLELRLHDTKCKHSEVSDELNHTIKCTEKLENGILELKSSKRVLKTVGSNTEVAITELKKDLDSVNFKHQNAQKIKCDLTSEIEKIRQKMEKDRESHALHLDCRKKTLKKDKSVLDVSLIENRKLASKYKALQRIYLHKKDTCLDLFEKRVTLEASIRDRTQLSVLQRRMHSALLQYFKLRGLYSQAGLATCQAASHENAQKILAVQEEMSKTIQQISAFVNSLTDGSSSEGGKANNRPISEAATKDGQSHTVQKTV